MGRYESERNFTQDTSSEGSGIFVDTSPVSTERNYVPLEDLIPTFRQQEVVPSPESDSDPIVKSARIGMRISIEGYDSACHQGLISRANPRR